MANTFSQLNVQCIFATKGRESLIHDHFKDDLFKYMVGILKNEKIFPLAVNGWKDHVHLFMELPPNKALSDVVRILKASSSKWVNNNNLLKGGNFWQEGFGAFSYSKSQRDTVINYILKQEEHHKITTFKEEYLGLLKEFNIPYDAKYLFEFYE